MSSKKKKKQADATATLPAYRTERVSLRVHHVICAGVRMRAAAEHRTFSDMAEEILRQAVLKPSRPS